MIITQIKTLEWPHFTYFSVLFIFSVEMPVKKFNWEEI